MSQASNAANSARSVAKSVIRAISRPASQLSRAHSEGPLAGHGARPGAVSLYDPDNISLPPSDAVRPPMATGDNPYAAFTGIFSDPLGEEPASIPSLVAREIGALNEGVNEVKALVEESAMEGLHTQTKVVALEERMGKLEELLAEQIRLAKRMEVVLTAMQRAPMASIKPSGRDGMSVRHSKESALGEEEGGSAPAGETRRENDKMSIRDRFLKRQAEARKGKGTDEE